MPLIFISYRRAESDMAAGRIADRLKEHFGSGSVFMDIESIELGKKYPEQIDGMLDRCDVMVALIDRRWSSKLKNEADWVRREIEAALARDIVIIPVLLNQTRQPDADALPPKLKPLLLYQWIDLDSGDFHVQMDRVVNAIRNAKPKASAKEPSQTPVTAPKRLPLWQRKQRFFLGLAVAMITAVSIVALLPPSRDRVPEPTSPTPSGPTAAPQPGTTDVVMLDRLSREIERGCFPFQLGHPARNLPSGLQAKVDQHIEQIHGNLGAGQKVKIVAATQLSYDLTYSATLAERNAEQIKTELLRRGFGSEQVETVTVLPANEQLLEFPRLGDFDCLAYVRQ